MSLIQCPECDREISDQAISCPQCGYSLREENIQVSTAPGKPIELEFTSKKWKRVILVSWLVIILGFIFGNLIGGQNSPNGFALGLSLSMLGVIGLIIGKIGAWYSNR